MVLHLVLVDTYLTVVDTHLLTDSLLDRLLTDNLLDHLPTDSRLEHLVDHPEDSNRLLPAVETDIPVGMDSLDSHLDTPAEMDIVDSFELGTVHSLVDLNLQKKKQIIN